MDKNFYYAIDFTPKTMELDSYGLLTSDKVKALWIKLVLAGARAGTVVRGRQVVAPSFLVDQEFLAEFDGGELEKLVSYGLIKSAKVNPSKVKPKLVTLSSRPPVGRPMAEQADEFLSESSKAFDTFWDIYPFRGGMKLKKAEARAVFNDVVDSSTVSQLMETVYKYKQSSQVANGFAKDAVNWLKEWQSWINFDPSAERSGGRVRVNQANINRAEDDKVII